jgi:hypothetical protein
MKQYIAFNTFNTNWWDGKTFHPSNSPLLIDASTLAVLKEEYGHVMSVEVVSLPTIAEDEFERQKAEKQANVSPWEYVKDEYRKDPTPYKT